jgi:hypothetical protein
LDPTNKAALLNSFLNPLQLDLSKGECLVQLFDQFRRLRVETTPVTRWQASAMLADTQHAATMSPACCAKHSLTTPIGTLARTE